MSCHGIVITMPSGRKLCIPIYRPIWKWPFGPQPDPWLDDLVRLVVVNDIIAELNDRGVRDSLAKAVHGAAGKVSLPEGVALGDGLFKGKMPTAA